MDIANLTPEQKDTLLMQLAQKYEADMPQAESQDYDYSDLCKAIDMLVKMVEDHDEQISNLRKMVVDDLFGGIKGMYDEGVRTKGIDELRGKYEPLFKDHIEKLKGIEPDVDKDLFGKLYDQKSEMSGQEGFTDEAFDAKVNEYVPEIVAMIKKLQDEGKIPKDAEVEVEISEPEAPRMGAGEAFAKKLKDRNESVKKQSQY